MGVKNLWRLFRPYGEEHVSVEGKRLAVDVSIWMHQLKHVPEPQAVYTVSKRVLKLLCSGITPLFVFDGGVPALKRRTMEARREQRSRRCGECGQNACRHSSLLDPETIRRMDDEAIQRIREHGFNWGEFSDDLEEDSDGPADVRPDRQDQPAANPLSAFSVEDLSGLAAPERLRRLLEVGQYRKLPMPVDMSTPDAFSLSQIENLKKRSLVSALTRSLSGGKRTRVQSDWRYCVEYEREDEAQTHASFFGRSSKKEEPAPVSEGGDAPGGMFGDVAGPSGASEGQEQKRLKTEFMDRYRGIVASASMARKVPVQDGTGACPQQEDRRHTRGRAGAKSGADGWVTVFEDGGKDAPGRETQDKWGGAGEPRMLSYRDCQFLQGQRHAFTGPGASGAAGDPGPGKQADFVNQTGVFSESVLRVQGIIKTILTAFSICFIESPEEADSQCGYLFDKNVIDGVITEDNDLLVHGATVYKNFFSKSKSIAVYTFEGVSRGLSLSRRDMVRLSFLLGSDYTPGVFGIGVGRALERIGAVSDEDIAGIEAIYNHLNVVSVGGFENGRINRVALERLLCRSGVSRDRADEILFFVKKLVAE